MADEIVNRVAKSSLQQVDLDAWMPNENDIVTLDINAFLVDNILFTEKYFRETVEKFEFSVFNEKYVCITNHVEAIVPLWAYMILATKLQNAHWYGFTNKNDVHNEIIAYIISKKDLSEYKDKPVIVKGCGKYEFSPNIYMLITKRLAPIAKSVMYGEACSSVPVYKKMKK
jgi:hypothetical protein